MATEKLTAAQIKGLIHAPFFGFPAGSNMWPLVSLYPGTDKEVIGEDIDVLLRRGLLVASLLPKPILSEQSPDPDVVPDVECTHEVAITEAGREALKAEDGRHG